MKAKRKITLQSLPPNPVMKRLLFHSLLSHTSSMVNILSATITKSSRFCCVAGPSPLFPLFPQNINLQSDGMLSLPAL